MTASFVLLRQKIPFFVAKNTVIFWHRLNSFYPVWRLPKWGDVVKPVTGFTFVMAGFFTGHWFLFLVVVERSGNFLANAAAYPAKNPCNSSVL